MVKRSKAGNEKVRGLLQSDAEEAHGVAETLMKICAVKMATYVLGELSKMKLAAFQLPNITAKRRIQDISADIERTIVVALPLQLGQSAD
jgi:hypothetical protein